MISSRPWMSILLMALVFGLLTGAAELAWSQIRCEALFANGSEVSEWTKLRMLEDGLEAKWLGSELEAWRLRAAHEAVASLVSILEKQELRAGRDFSIQFDDETLSEIIREQATIGRSLHIDGDLRLPYVVIYPSDRLPRVLSNLMGRMRGAVEAVVFHPMKMRLQESYGMYHPLEKRVYLRAPAWRAIFEENRLDGVADHEFQHALLHGRRRSGQESIFDIGFATTPHHSKLPGRGYTFYLASEELMTFLRSNLKDVEVDVYRRLRDRGPQLLELMALFKPAVSLLREGRGRLDGFPTMSIEKTVDGYFEVTVVEHAESTWGVHPGRKILFWVNRGHREWSNVEEMYHLQTVISREGGRLVREPKMTSDKISDLDLAFMSKRFRQIEIESRGERTILNSQEREAYDATGLSELFVEFDQKAGAVAVHFLKAMERLSEAAKVAQDGLAGLGENPEPKDLRARVAEIKSKILNLDRQSLGDEHVGRSVMDNTEK